RDAIAQRRGRNVDLSAMLRVRFFQLFADIDAAPAALPHVLQHPHDIVTVRVDRVGEVEAATATLWTGNDEQVGEAVAMQTQERLGPLGLPLFLQGAAAAAC